MGRDHKVSCLLCRRSEETETTGALSTKGPVTAHQHCLLYASGICCQTSPTFDDLFGFSVEDVLEEEKRGRRLRCNFCGHKGATAGCEVKRCKRSYHYPCAVEAEAQIIEDTDGGQYGILCFQHQENDEMNGHASTSRPQTSIHPASSKVRCPTCERTEGNISLDSLSSNVITSYCDEHAPSSHKNTTAAACSTSSGSSTSTRCSSKRRLSVCDTQAESPNKRKPERWHRIESEGSSTDQDDPNTDMDLFAPLESDLEESAPEQQFTSRDAQSPTGVPPGNHQEDENRAGHQEDDGAVLSDAESESLLPEGPRGNSPATQTAAREQVVQLQAEAASLPPSRQVSDTQSTVLPVEVCIDSEALSQSDTQTEPAPAASSFTQEPESDSLELPVEICIDTQSLSLTSTQPFTQSVSPAAEAAEGEHGGSSLFVPPVSPHSRPGTPPDMTSDESSGVPETSHVTTPTPLASDLQASTDSVSFWKSCNAAGCTEAIFTDFFSGMKDIYRRILSDQVSRQDCDVALAVMAASGSLAASVAKQQKELQRKQLELQKAAAAMRKLVSALRSADS